VLKRLDNVLSAAVSGVFETTRELVDLVRNRLLLHFERLVTIESLSG
jgi:hypothetical protein